MNRHLRQPDCAEYSKEKAFLSLPFLFLCDICSQVFFSAPVQPHISMSLFPGLLLVFA